MRCSRQILLLGTLTLLSGDTARAAEALDPLYERIAEDLKQGKPLVVTVHVALCDNSIIWCGAKMGDGDRPRDNLYWGRAGGFQAYFQRARGYRRIFKDAGDSKVVLEREVYRLQVRRPSAAWRRRGVTRPFEVLLVGLAYRGRSIDQAHDSFVRQVLGEAGSQLTLDDGRVIPIGGMGHVVGYAGHNRLMDLLEYRFPRRTRRSHVGFFALACRTGQYYGRELGASPAHGLLLTLTLMYPGAFTIDGILRGVAAGERQHAVYMRGVQMYARYQRRPVRVIRAAFTNDRQPRFLKRFSRARVER